MPRDQSIIPGWVCFAYTLLVAVVIPSYWVLRGPANFLWLSDVTLILLVPAMWWRSRILGSMLAVAVLPLELGWVLSFLMRLLGLTGLLGLTDYDALTGYMFDADKLLYLRILSGAFHLVLPVALIGLVVRLGYDRRAPWLQTPLTWLVLLASYAVASPGQNINFVLGLGHGELWRPIPQPWYLIGLMLAFPVLVHIPTHLVLRHWWGARPSVS